jgi:2-haloacid dehalogenase
MKQLTDFKALTFDCYGTLIDWEAGLLAALGPLAARSKPPRSRQELLEAFAVHESSQEHYTPTLRYSQLLAVVYKRIAENWGTPAPWDECVAFGQSVRAWQPFADTVESLRYLKQHYKLYILSNVDNETFSHTARKLEVPFDGIMTAEDIGTYKPNLQNFTYMLERLESQGIRKDQVLHVAQSLFHDHRAANELGIASCWIDRRHGTVGSGATRTPDRMPHLDFQFRSLAELVEAHRKALQG